METTIRTYVEPATYGGIIRSYSDNVGKGLADTDLNPRQRRLVAMMLNLASNGAMSVPYASLREDDRDAAVKRLSDLWWDAYWLVVAAAPRVEADADAARDRAVAILRGC